jgi:hypothetical protein
LPGGDGQISAHLEPSWRDLAWLSPVGQHVPAEVSQAAHQTEPTGFDGPLEHGRVAGREVGRVTRLDDLVDGEVQLGPPLSIERGLVRQPSKVLGEQQVLWRAKKYQPLES